VSFTIEPIDRALDVYLRSTIVLDQQAAAG